MEALLYMSLRRADMLLPLTDPDGSATEAETRWERLGSFHPVIA